MRKYAIMELIENPDQLLKYLKHKNLAFVAGEEIKGLSVVKKLSEYEFQGEMVKLIEYKALTEKGEKRFCGYASSKKDSRKLLNKKLLLNYLWQRDFSKGNLLVTRPLTFVPELNLLLREKAEGQTLLWALRQKKPLLKIIENSAKWLLKLHQLNPEEKKFAPITEIEKQEFKHYLEVARNCFPQKIAQKIEDFLRLIHQTSQEFSENTLIHGDFQPPNIIYKKEGSIITVIDFDWSGLGDRLSDLGNFLVQFDYHAAKILTQKKIIVLKSTFVNTYFAESKNFSNLAQRINAYQAKFALQRAISITEFTLADCAKAKENQTVLNLLQKAESSLQNKEKINLKVYK